MLVIEGNYTLHAPAQRVWPLIFDPNTLINLVPGCQQLDQVAPLEYRGHLRIGIAAVSGKYDTEVKIVESDPPNHCSFDGLVSGATGTITGRATFSLQEQGQDTLLTYKASGMISGALGTVSSRILESLAKTFINQGMAKLDQQLQAELEARG
jgi:carbon monoxide dehydrogenase subunit G